MIFISNQLKYSIQREYNKVQQEKYGAIWNGGASCTVCDDVLQCSRKVDEFNTWSTHFHMSCNISYQSQSDSNAEVDIIM